MELHLTRKLQEHINIGGDYERIIWTWHFTWRENGALYGCSVSQSSGTGNLSRNTNWRNYRASGTRHFYDNVKDKRKQKIIAAIKKWFDDNGENWLNVEEE